MNKIWFLIIILFYSCYYPFKENEFIGVVSNLSYTNNVKALNIYKDKIVFDSYEHDDIFIGDYVSFIFNKNKIVNDSIRTKSNLNILKQKLKTHLDFSDLPTSSNQFLDTDAFNFKLYPNFFNENKFIERFYLNEDRIFLIPVISEFRSYLGDLNQSATGESIQSVCYYVSIIIVKNKKIIYKKTGSYCSGIDIVNNDYFKNIRNLDDFDWTIFTNELIKDYVDRIIK